MQLRHEGGSGMFGTAAAFVTASIIAPKRSGSTLEQVALRAAMVGTSVFLTGLVLSFFLPEPKKETSAE